MKKKLNFILVILIIGVLMLGCSSGNNGSKPADKPAEKSSDASKENKPQYIWKFAHEEIPGSVQDNYAQKFKEIIEKKSNGNIQIEVYPVGQLGDGTNQVELLQNGGVEFVINCPGAVGPIIPESNIFSLHFLLPSNMKKTRELLNTSKAIEKMNEIYYKQSMKVLDWFPEGYMMWTGNKEIRKPEDFRGFKIRTMASPMIAATYEAYGANPTPIPYMEVYSSLQLKMIDGQVNPIFAIEEMKFYEVQDYLMLSKQDIFVGTFVANAQYWESLPEDVKKMVVDTVKEVNPYIYEVQDKLNTERLEKIKKASDIKIVELTDEERDVFRKASMPAREKYLELGGPKAKEILELLVQDAEQIEAKK